MTEADTPPGQTDPQQPFVESSAEPTDETAGFEEAPVEGYYEQDQYAEGEVPADEQVDLATEPEGPEAPTLEDFAKVNQKNYVRRRPNEWVPPKDFKPVVFTEKTNLVVEHENHSARMTMIVTGIVVVVCGALLSWYIYAVTHPEPMPAAAPAPPKIYVVQGPTTAPTTMPGVPITQPAPAAN